MDLSQCVVVIGVKDGIDVVQVLEAAWLNVQPNDVVNVEDPFVANVKQDDIAVGKISVNDLIGFFADKRQSLVYGPAE